MKNTKAEVDSESRAREIAFLMTTKLNESLTVGSGGEGLGGEADGIQRFKKRREISWHPFLFVAIRLFKSGQPA